MRLEELKAEADKQGYILIKKRPYVPLVVCPNCGKRPKPWISAVSGKTKYKCECQSTDWIKGDRSARIEWNKMVDIDKTGNQ